MPPMSTPTQSYEAASNSEERLREADQLIEEGEALLRKDDLTAACEVLRRAIVLLEPGGGPSSQRLANALCSLATAERDLGHLKTAVSLCKRALELFQSVADPHGASRASSCLGIIYKDLGHLTEARARLTHALHLLAPLLEQGVPLHLYQGHALVGLGLTLMKQHDFEEAARCFKQALEAYRQVDNPAEHLAAALHNLGAAYDNLEQYNIAKDYYEQSLKLNQQIDSKLGIADDLNALASLHLLEEEFSAARELDLEVLHLYEQLGHGRGIIQTRIDLAIIAREEGNLPQAEEHLTKALRVAGEVGDPQQLHEVLLNRGDVRLMGSRWREAEEDLMAAAEVLERTRLLLLGEEEALGYFSGEYAGTYERLVQLHARVFQDGRQALLWLERGKARELIRRVGVGARLRPRQAPADLEMAEAHLLERLQQTAASLSAGGETWQLEALQAYTAIEAELRAIWSRLAHFDPQYVELRRGQPVAWERLGECLQRAQVAGTREVSGREGAAHGEVVLAELFLAHDSLLIFLVRAGAEQPLVLDMQVDAQQLRKLVMTSFGVQRAVAEQFGKTGIGGAEVLVQAGEWQQILQPLGEALVRTTSEGDILWLVPHEVLHGLPLHALKIEGGQRHLIDRNPVCYTPSATVMQYCHARRKGRRERALVLGDSRGDLGHAREESCLVAELFGTSAYLGPEATGRQLLEHLSREQEQIDVLHLACHGHFNPTQPLKSAIALASEAAEGCDGGQGELRAEEILGLRLGVDLVTLSACESGVGELRPGDEALGLVRALLYSGVPSVLVSLWRVDDLSTSLLMQRFYQELLGRKAREGGTLPNKAEALQAAQCYLRGLSAKDVIDYCDERLASLPQAGGEKRQLLLELGRAAAQVYAGDLRSALSTYRQSLAWLRQRDDPWSREHAWQLAETVDALELKASEDATRIDYTVKPYTEPYHWAPFVLIGDWQ